MAIDISNLAGKQDNTDGSAGRLTADNWNTLVRAVKENQDAVESNKGRIRGIKYNGGAESGGQTFDKIDSNGYLEMEVISSDRIVKINTINDRYPSPNPKYGNHYITPNDSCYVEFAIEDVKNGVPFNQAGVVELYINNDLVDTINNVFPFGSDNYKGSILIDFSKYNKFTATTDANEIKIKYINNGKIETEAYYVWMRDIKLLISNINNIYTTNDLQNIKYSLSGYDKYFIYAKIDDTFILEGIECDSTDDTFIKGNDTLVSQCNTHGVHKLSIWAEVQIPDSEFKLSTPIQEFTYIFGDIKNITPVIITNIASNSEYEIYNNLSISYYAYLSNANTKKKINISLISSNNEIISETNQYIQFENDRYNDVYSFVLFPTGNLSENDIIGNAKITLSIDDNVPFEVPIVITPSSIKLTQETNYYAYFTANGRSNNDDNKNVWTSINKDNEEVTVSFDPSIKFNQNGSGWNIDNEGNTAMHLRRGNTFTVNYEPFAINPVYNSGVNYGHTEGLTISIEFATRNCLNANAKVIECMNDNIGFYVTAGEAYLKSNTSTLKTSFKEDTRIKLDIVIEDKLREYTYSSAIGKKGELKERTESQSYAIMFIDGVYSGVCLIQPDTTFKQNKPQPITFGSKDCDLDIYNIRIYRKPLTIKAIIDNYSYDTPNIKDKIEIARRNLGILVNDENNPFLPKIIVEKTALNGSDGGLKVARPDLPIFYFTQDADSKDIMANTKDGDGISSFTQFVNPLHNSPLSSTEAMASFEMKAAGIKNQGTSSMNYPWPWRNLDWKPLGEPNGDKIFYMPKLESSVYAEKWYQYPYNPYNKNTINTNIGIKKITLKKDYASSEMCNNAITSDYFNEMALGIYSDYIDESDYSTTKHTYNPGVLSPAMYEDIKSQTDSKKHTDLRLALKALPCFCIQKLTKDVTDKMIKPNTLENNFAVGMMNLIPNKNEVGYLGFKKNVWENGDEGITAREQSWELKDNFDDVFWVKPIKYLEKISVSEDGSESEYVSDLDGKYEARTPKDSVAISSDFGILKGEDRGDGIKSRYLTEDEADKLFDEQKDIIDFHNWACSVDRGNATNKPLTEIDGWELEDWNIDYKTGNQLHTHDTAEYRKLKFKSEAEKYLLIDQWILYYIWREQFWMYDSGFKNLQVYTVGPNPKFENNEIMQWGCMVRDADTALGIQNVGQIVFPPHLEDVDYGVQEGDENSPWTFYYNGAENVYSDKQLKDNVNSSGQGVLHGQFGSIWLNLRDVFYDRIADMYNKLTNSSTANFSANAAIKKFREHQENWSESLYNFGLRQYIGGALFTDNLNAACGDKKHSRAQWLERAFFYRASKYRSLGDDKFNLRARTYEIPDDEPHTDSLNIKTYIPMYIGVGGSDSSHDKSAHNLRVVEQDEHGNYFRNIKVGAGGFEYGPSADTNNYVFGLSMITDFDDLARYIKVSSIGDMKYAPKIRKFQLGHEKERDGNEYHEIIIKKGEKVREKLTNDLLRSSIDFSVCSQLELLDLTNHVLLPGITIDKCLQLKELYLRGTNTLTSLQLPKTESLETLYLGDKLQGLNLSDLSGIKKLVIDGLPECKQLIIKNSGELISGNVSYNLMKQVINNNVSTLILEDIVWDLKEETDAIGYLEKILELRKQYGKANISLKGKILNLKGLTNDIKVKLCDEVNGFGNIDNTDNDLYISYTHTEIKTVSLPNKTYIFEPGDTQMIFNTDNEYSNTFKSAKWSLSNNNYATIDESTGIITRNTIPANEHTDFATLTVTIYQIPDKDDKPRDPVYSNECKVYFYERLAKPGDIVFHDGTYSDELETGKTPIGVCFYVDPDNKNNRLMVALKNIYETGANNTYRWGIGTGGPQGSGTYGSPQVNPKDYGFDSNSMSVIINTDVKEIQMHGSSPDKEQLLDNSLYRNDELSNNNFFAKFPSNTFMGSIGWVKINDDYIKNFEDIEIDGKTVIERDKQYPIGYFNTMAIIKRRNQMMKYNDDLKITGDKNGASEYFNLFEDIRDAEKLKINGWNEYSNTYLYPAASLAYAYEPTNENDTEITGLNSKFKKHNWFIPASGDVVRLSYYFRQYYVNSDTQKYDDENAFKTAINTGTLKTAGWLNSLNSGVNILSSTETLSNGEKYIAVITTGVSLQLGDSRQGICIAKNKYDAAHLRPICVF